MISEPIRLARTTLQSHEETAVVHNLIQAAGMAGIRADRQDIVNVYVSLKTRPFLILAGEKQTGKIELVKCLGHVLTEIPAQQCQFLIGHARWAAQSQDVSRFVEMQDRFNRNKLLALMEEAWQRKKANRLFIACLTRISPAELYDYFPEAGFQFWPVQEGKGHSSADMPIPYPPNFRLIGTMDTTRFVWWGVDLLRHSTVIQWPTREIEKKIEDIWKTDFHNPVPHFLQTCIHNEQKAYARLRRLLQGQRQAFLPLMQVLATLEDSHVILPAEVMRRIVVYLANAWSEEGHGLFAPLPSQNLNPALDLALAQYVLPWIIAMKPDAERLLSRLALGNGQFEQTSAFIGTLLEKPSLAISHQPNYR